jgi:CRP-like cAMP-binding protein
LKRFAVVGLRGRAAALLEGRYPESIPFEHTRAHGPRASTSLTSIGLLGVIRPTRWEPSAFITSRFGLEPNMANHLTADGSAVDNRLLAHLPAAAFARIDSHLVRVPLTVHDRLLKPGMATEYVYFPESGMVSLVLSLEDGAIVEVGLVGAEGLVGVLPALGTSRATVEAVVQLPGHALKMRTDALRKEFGLNPALRSILMNYVQALFIQVSQSVACNSHHTLAERLARWLLMATDCGNTSEVALSHEFLAMMLGVQRPSVTLTIGELREKGILVTSHGRIRVVDRKGLEQAACECYETVKREYDRLLP